MDDQRLWSRQRLMDSLRRILEINEPQDFDDAGEAAYASLYQLGAVLDDAEEISSLARVMDTLDQMFSVIGNCRDEEQNLKRMVWAQVVDQAHAAYQIFTTE